MPPDEVPGVSDLLSNASCSHGQQAFHLDEALPVLQNYIWRKCELHLLLRPRDKNHITDDKMFIKLQLAPIDE
jgi:hypothetical protein